MQRSKSVQRTLWLAVLVWMGVIFSLSQQTGEQSGKLSSGVTEVIVQTVEKVVPTVHIDRISFHAFMRKNAHFAAFFMLGTLTSVALHDGKRTRNTALWQALALCAAYAAGDEVHQLFIPGRGGQITDVLIDTAGSAFGIAVANMLLHRKNAPLDLLTEESAKTAQTKNTRE